jgi:hypothetical protein
MIPIHADCLYLYPISLFYARSRFSDYPDNLFAEKEFPIVDGEDDVTMNLSCTVVPFSDGVVTIHLPSIARSPAASYTKLSSQNRGIQYGISSSNVC